MGFLNDLTVLKHNVFEVIEPMGDDTYIHSICPQYSGGEVERMMEPLRRQAAEARALLERARAELGLALDMGIFESAAVGTVVTDPAITRCIDEQATAASQVVTDIDAYLANGATQPTAADVLAAVEAVPERRCYDRITGEDVPDRHTDGYNAGRTACIEAARRAAKGGRQ